MLNADQARFCLRLKLLEFPHLVRQLVDVNVHFQAFQEVKLRDEARFSLRELTLSYRLEFRFQNFEIFEWFSRMNENEERLISNRVWNYVNFNNWQLTMIIK